MFYQLENSKEKDFRYKTEMVKSNYFNYYNKKKRSDLEGFIVAESRVGTKLRENLDIFES